MCTISPREGERHFLRTLLLHKSGATSFANLRVHEGVQHSTFREACYALGLLSDDAEWIRCMKDTFSSNFDSLTDVFAIIMAFLNQQILFLFGKKRKMQWESISVGVMLEFLRGRSY